MSVSEEERHELYLALEEAHGRARATTLMSLLPPVGWADVATKRDLDQLEERMELRFERLEAATSSRLERVESVTTVRFNAIEHRLGLIESELAAGRGERWKMFFMLVGIQLTAAGVIVAMSNLP